MHWRASQSAALAASIALATMLSSGAPVFGLDAGPLLVSADAGTSSGSDGTDGRASGEFTFNGESLEDATAVVNAGGGGLRVRSEPSLDADIVAKLPDGATVDLRIAETDTVIVIGDGDVTRWWPVAVGGSSGWVSGDFLADADGASVSSAGDGTAGSERSTETTDPPNEQFTFEGSELVGATAIVSGSSADVYTEPSADSEVLTSVAGGTEVRLRIDVADSTVGPDGETRWWPVSVAGIDGWISGFALANPGSQQPTSSSESEADVPTTLEAAAVDGDSEVFPAGSVAIVQTETSRGARLREAFGTDSAKVVSVAEFTEVIILSGPVSFENSVNGWFEVEANGETGFIDGDLLVLMSTPEPTTVPPTPTVEPAQAPSVEPTSVPEETTTSERQSDDDGDSNPLSTATAPASDTDDQARQSPNSTATVTSAGNDDQGTPASTQAAARSQEFILPVEDAILTQGFGCSPLGFYPYNPDWGCGVHDGIDYAAPSGTPILAVGDGTVVEAGFCDCGLGYYVEIDHGNNLHTIYGHMASQPVVSVGQQVSQGETIGPVGSTGLSTGPHTHFMVQVNGISQDPGRYVP